MKLALIAGLALAASLMEEAEAGTSSGGGAAETSGAKPGDAVDTAPNLADTSGDTEHQPAGLTWTRLQRRRPRVRPWLRPSRKRPTTSTPMHWRPGKPKVALVGKYADRIPVQLKSLAHLAQLKAEHGEGFVEVVS
jgi:hypothetical protein